MTEKGKADFEILSAEKVRAADWDNLPYRNLYSSESNPDF